MVSLGSAGGETVGQPHAQASSFAPLIGLIGAIGTMAAVWAWLGNLQLTEPQVWAVATVGLGSFCLLFGTLSGRSGPLLITFWPFLIVTMGVAPLAQSKLQTYPRADAGLAEFYADSQLICLLACLVWAIWYFRSVGASHASKNDGHVLQVSDVAVARRLRVAALLGIAAFPLSLASGTGIASRFQSRDDLIAAYSNAGIAYADGQSIQLALLKTMPTAFAVVSAMIASYEFSQRRRTDVAMTNIVIVALISATAFIVFANPLSNGRYTAFSALLAVIFCMTPFPSRAGRAIFSAALVVGLVTIYPAAATFKNEAASARIEQGTAAFTTVDFDSMQQSANAVYYVKSRGHTDGRVTLSAALFFVPRSIWTDKELPSSYLTSEARGYGPLNLSQPLWSELYIDFGWAGAIGGLAIVGHGAGRLDRTFNRRSRTGAWSILPAAFSALQVGFLRGPMGAIMVYTAAVLLLATWTVWWSGRATNDS